MIQNSINLIISRKRDGWKMVYVYPLTCCHDRLEIKIPFLLKKLNIGFSAGVKNIGLAL
jgi:hypothetical protein